MENATTTETQTQDDQIVAHVSALIKELGEEIESKAEQGKEVTHQTLVDWCETTKQKVGGESTAYSNGEVVHYESPPRTNTSLVTVYFSRTGDHDNNEEYTVKIEACPGYKKGDDGIQLKKERVFDAPVKRLGTTSGRATVESKLDALKPYVVSRVTTLTQQGGAELRRAQAKALTEYGIPNGMAASKMEISESAFRSYVSKFNSGTHDAKNRVLLNHGASRDILASEPVRADESKHGVPYTVYAVEYLNPEKVGGSPYALVVIDNGPRLDMHTVNFDSLSELVMSGELRHQGRTDKQDTPLKSIAAQLRSQGYDVPKVGE